MKPTRRSAVAMITGYSTVNGAVRPKIIILNTDMKKRKMWGSVKKLAPAEFQSGHIQPIAQ